MYYRDMYDNYNVWNAVLPLCCCNIKRPNDHWISLASLGPLSKSYTSSSRAGSSMLTFAHSNADGSGNGSARTSSTWSRRGEREQRIEVKYHRNFPSRLSIPRLSERTRGKSETSIQIIQNLKTDIEMLSCLRKTITTMSNDIEKYRRS